MNTKRLANQIARAFREIQDDDVSVFEDASNLSNSCYVEIVSERADDAVKIRIAGHDPRPTYEMRSPSDFHVGSIVRRDGSRRIIFQYSDGDWLAAVAWACDRLGLAVPKRILGLIARRDAAIEARRVAVAAETQRQQDDYAARNAARDAALGMISDDARGVLADYAATSGKKRKHFRSTAKYRRAIAELQARLDDSN